MSQRSELERVFSKKFRASNDPAKVYYDALKALGRAGLQADEPFRVAGQWLLDYGRPIPVTDMLLLVKYLESEASFNLAAAYLTCVVLQKAKAAGGCPVHPALFQFAVVKNLGNAPDGHPAAQMVLEALERAIRPFEQDDLMLYALEDTRMRLALHLLHRGDQVGCTEGLHMLEAQLARVRTLIERSIPFAPSFLGGLLHNLGEAWTRRRGEKGALARGVELLRECASLPSRAEEPVRLELTLRSLGISLRHLANEHADVGAMIPLLEESERMLHQAVRLASDLGLQDVELRIAGKISLANTRIELAAALESVGEMAPALALAQKREAALWGIKVIEAVPRESLVAENWTALERFMAIVGRSEAMDRRVLERLESLWTTWLRREDPSLNTSEAQSLSHLMLSRNHAAFLEFGLERTAALLAAISPRNVGLGLARDLMSSEANLAARLFSGSEQALWPSYRDTRFAALREATLDPLSIESERNVASAWLRHLVILELERTETGLPEESFLSAADWAGCAAFRGDSSFFDSVNTRGGSKGRPSGERPRLVNLRARMDMCGSVSTLDELRSIAGDARYGLPEGMAEALHSIPPASEFLPFLSVAGDEVSQHPVENPHAELRELRLALAAAINGLEDKNTQKVDRQAGLLDGTDIRHYLESHPDTAVLSTVGERRWSVTFAAGGLIRAVEIGPIPGSAEWEEVMRCLEDVEENLALSLGPPVPRELLGVLSLPKGMQPPNQREALRKCERVMSQMLEALGPVAQRIGDAASDHKLSQVLVLERHTAPRIPWEALPFALKNGSSVALGERVAFVRTLTLRPHSARSNSHGSDTLDYVGCSEASLSALQLGRVALDRNAMFFAGVGGREAFESAACRSGRIRLFAHGYYVGFPAGASGVVLDESNPFPPWTRDEIRCLPLGQCKRVELWACETAYEMDFAGMFLGHEEPNGIAAAFLAAQAGMVIGARWKVAAMPAAIIADAFDRFTSLEASARMAAIALAKALSLYRRLVEPGGVVEEAVRNALTMCDSGTGAHNRRLNEVMLAGFEAARQAVWSEAGGTPPEPIPAGVLSKCDAVSHLAPMTAEEASLTSRVEIEKAVESVLDSLRCPMAWAGWRVLVAGTGD